MLNKLRNIIRRPARAEAPAPSPPDVRWERLRAHPGFVIIDSDGAHRAYFHCRPDDAIIREWKRRYPDHAEMIDAGLAACFPLED